MSQLDKIIKLGLDVKAMLKETEKSYNEARKDMPESVRAYFDKTVSDAKKGKITRSDIADVVKKFTEMHNKK